MRKMKSSVVASVLAGVVVVLVASLPANAWIVVNFNTISTGVYGDYNLGTYDSLDDLVYQGLVQVMWTPDTTIGSLNQGLITPSGTDNDRILAQTDTGTTDFLTSDYGQISGDTGLAIKFDTPSGETQGSFTSGYVYLRVFDSATPSLGSYYVSGSLTGVGDVWGDALTWGDSGTPVDPTARELLDMTGSGDTVAGSGTLSGYGVVPMDSQVVPEPATFALFGLGLATLALRRRRG